MKIRLGQVVATRGVAARIEDNEEYRALIVKALARHESGDWGDMCAEDREANDRALKHGGRLLSAYTVEGDKIWIITEHDRSVTTILFPDEY